MVKITKGQQVFTAAMTELGNYLGITFDIKHGEKVTLVEAKGPHSPDRTDKPHGFLVGPDGRNIKAVSLVMSLGAQASGVKLSDWHLDLGITDADKVEPMESAAGDFFGNLMRLLGLEGANVKVDEDDRNVRVSITANPDIHSATKCPVRAIYTLGRMWVYNGNANGGHKHFDLKVEGFANQ